MSKLSVTVKFFATLRERAKTSELRREFASGTTVGQMWRSLREEFPQLQGHAGSVSFAVNHEYVKDDFHPRDGDEVAFIPPVSGGIGDEASWLGPITIGRAPIDVAVLERAVADPGAGGAV